MLLLHSSHSLDLTSALADFLLHDAIVLSKLFLKFDLFHSQFIICMNLTFLKDVVYSSLLCSSVFLLLLFLMDSRALRVNVQHFDSLFHVFLCVLLFNTLCFSPFS